MVLHTKKPIVLIFGNKSREFSIPKVIGTRLKKNPPSEILVKTGPNFHSN